MLRARKFIAAIKVQQSIRYYGGAVRALSRSRLIETMKYIRQIYV